MLTLPRRLSANPVLDADSPGSAPMKSRNILAASAAASASNITKRSGNRRTAAASTSRCSVSPIRRRTAGSLEPRRSRATSPRGRRRSGTRTCCSARCGTGSGTRSRSPRHPSADQTFQSACDEEHSVFTARLHIAGERPRGPFQGELAGGVPERGGARGRSSRTSQGRGIFRSPVPTSQSIPGKAVTIALALHELSHQRREVRRPLATGGNGSDPAGTISGRSGEGPAGVAGARRAGRGKSPPARGSARGSSSAASRASSTWSRSTSSRRASSAPSSSRGRRGHSGRLRDRRTVASPAALNVPAVPRI